jgi:hypothetical protein
MGVTIHYQLAQRKEDVKSTLLFSGRKNRLIRFEW